MSDEIGDTDAPEWETVEEGFRESYQKLTLARPAQVEFIDHFLAAWEGLDASRRPDEGFLQASKRLELSGGGALSYAKDGGWNMLEIAFEYPDAVPRAIEGLERLADDLRSEHQETAQTLDIYRHVLVVAAGASDRRDESWGQLCRLFGWPQLADREPSLETLQNQLDRLRGIEAKFRSAANLAGE